MSNKDLKTLKDIKKKYYNDSSEESMDCMEMVLRDDIFEDSEQGAREWIEELSQKQDEHWRKIEEHGFVDFPETDSEDAFGFTVDGIRFEEHYEADDVSAVINWIEHFFDLE